MQNKDDWTISGSTKAPNGYILAGISTNTSDFYNQDQAISTDNGNIVKIHDHHFSARIATYDAVNQDSKTVMRINAISPHLFSKSNLVASELILNNSKMKKIRKYGTKAVFQDNIKTSGNDSGSDNQSKSSQSISQSTTTNGNNTLSDLKKSVKKYINNQDSLIYSYSVSVNGMDSVKPYVANIIIKDNKDSQESFALATADIIKGIKKITYQNYSNIKITFESDLVDQYGTTVRNCNVLTYNFNKSTLNQIENTDNLTPSKLKVIADSYYKRSLKNN
ncbi:hypothetical protein [Secundilactobacillus muriivasis]